MTRPEVQVRWGYSLRDLDRLAQHAANSAFGRALHPPDRFDIAWTAIVQLLYEATEPPTTLDLHRAAVRAVQADNKQELHHHGIGDNGAQWPRYAAYWLHQHSTHSPEDRIVDRRALGEIWPLLSPLHQQALIALAIHENYDLAAAAVGTSYMTFAKRIQLARRRFLLAWHEHETPSRVWQRDQRIWRRPA